ncbi:hypothetical protein PENTCL1PPCAC_3707, partial [Pristionchus entomophagus]
QDFFFLKWVTEKSSYIFIIGDSNMFLIGGSATFLCYFCLTISTATMIGQMLIELKNGMNQRSTATKRYQKRADVSLVFHGIVPNMMYVVPAFALGGLYLNSLSMGLDTAARNQTISTASALVFALISTHTVTHSITILAFSPTYRRTIRSILPFPGSTAPRQSIQFLHSITKPLDR